MKLIFITVISLLSYSCSSTKTIYKEVVTPAKVSIDRSKTISIAEVQDHFEHGPAPRRFLSNREYANFAARSFENLFIERANLEGLNLVDRAKFNESFDDAFAGRQPRDSNADYLLYITYEEQSGLEPFSHDTEGLKAKKVFFAIGRVTYRVVERETGKIIASNSFQQKFNETNTDYLFVNGQQVYGPNTEQVALKLRKFLTSELVDEFFETKSQEALSFKKGENKIFNTVIENVEKNDLKAAILAQEEILKSLKGSNDISDGNYNLALLYYLTGDLEKARSVTKNVENGFFSKDFTHLVNKLN